MDLQAEKTELIKRLKQINDLSLIQAIKHLVDYGLKEKEGRISIEQYNKELDEADAEIDAGEYLTHEQAVKEIRSWKEK
ncbi:MAG: hypothetical protein KFF73_14700 [Cyclobacteriaceae bacterium]|nr:hypothetical protein [Cyclobacteriaceae bacterium]